MYKLITHNDLDGLACAILAKLAFGENISIEYAGKPDDVTKILNELIDNNLLNTKCFHSDRHKKKSLRGISFYFFGNKVRLHKISDNIYRVY